MGIERKALVKLKYKEFKSYEPDIISARRPEIFSINAKQNFMSLSFHRYKLHLNLLYVFICL